VRVGHRKAFHSKGLVILRADFSVSGVARKRRTVFLLVKRQIWNQPPSWSSPGIVRAPLWIRVRMACVGGARQRRSKWFCLTGTGRFPMKAGG